MSHTDKTDPWWVQIHHPDRTHEIHDHRNGICDINEWYNDPRHYNGTRVGWTYSACERDFNADGHRWRRVYGGVPKWFIDHTWYNPQRVVARETATLAKKLYNGGDDLEDFDFPVEQHRHRSSWWYC